MDGHDDKDDRMARKRTTRPAAQRAPRTPDGPDHLTAGEREKLGILINSIADEIWFCDAAGRFALVNEAALRGLGIEDETDIYRSITEWLATIEIFDPDGSRRAPEDAPLLRSLRGEILAGVEEIVRHPGTGQRLHRQVNSYPVRDAAGEIIGAVAIVRDITAYSRLRQEHERTRNMLESVYASLDEAVLVVDPHSRKILSCNAAAERCFGFDKHEMIGRNTEFIHVDKRMYRRFGQELTKALETGETFRTEFRLRRKDGTVFPSEHTVKPVRDASGLPVLHVSVVRDITFQRKATGELRKRAARLEELNTALKVLLEQREKDKVNIEAQLSESVNLLILPYIEKIRKTGLSDIQAECIDILETSLREMVKPYEHRLAMKLMHLSPAETRVAHYIKQGYRIKEIAAKLAVSPRTVEFHRDGIRKKLGLTGRRINLRKYLTIDH